MRLDYRAADGKPDTHALGFSGDEWPKNCLRVFRQSGANVSDRDLHFRIRGGARRHDNFSWCLSLCRLECVAHEVEYDLLKLDRIYKDRPLVSGEVEPQLEIRVSRTNESECDGVFDQLGSAHDALFCFTASDIVAEPPQNGSRPDGFFSRLFNSRERTDYSVRPSRFKREPSRTQEVCRGTERLV